MFNKQFVARNIIIGISILLCVLSAIIIYRAVVIHDEVKQSSDIPKEPELTSQIEKSEKVKEQALQESKDNSELINRIQATLNESELNMQQKKAETPVYIGPEALK